MKENTNEFVKSYSLMHLFFTIRYVLLSQFNQTLSILCPIALDRYKLLCYNATHQ